MVATGETVGLADWIIDDTCLVLFNFENFTKTFSLDFLKFSISLKF